METVQKTTVMPQRHRQPSIVTGAVVGLLLTVALTAIFFVGDVLIGTPFVPYDVLDWMARNLPGGLLTFGIDTMVSLVISLNLGETSAAAKNAEHFMGLAGMVVTGLVASAAFFAVMNSRDDEPGGFIPGIILGLIVGVPVALLSNAVNFTATTPPIISAAWILIAFVGWGVVVNWVYNDLAAIKAKSEDAAAVSAQALDRRSFLVRVGGAAATITVVGAGLGALLGEGESSTSVQTASTTGADTGTTPRADLPNADAVVQPVPGTRPELTPVEDHYRIDISSRPPVIDGETYTMPIMGEVGNPLDLTLNDLRNNYEPMTQYLTLACISNRLGGTLTSTQKWTGVSMQDILANADLSENAKYLRIFSADGFDETVDLELINQDERIMLTYAWDDEPLPEQNGFPLRIYIPDRYGMKQPKWITEMQVVDAYEDGYWVRRGWDRDAIMVTTSVIDVVNAGEAFEQDGQTFIPIGGMAHAGDRSISKVEVRVDDGEWTEVLLRDPISDKTWVLWRYEWPFVEGRHTFEVRAVDGDGEPQIETSRGVRPSGATGIFSVSEVVDVPVEA